MKKLQVLLILFLICFLMQNYVAYGQNKRQIKSLKYNGLVKEIDLCFNCNLKQIIKQVRHRIKEYNSDTNVVYILEKRDTLIEIVEYRKSKTVNYSFYVNNSLKLDYKELDSNDFVLTIMNSFERELKQWIVHPNEIHITDYDNNNNIKKYFAEIYAKDDKKLEFVKEWELGKFKLCEAKTYLKNKKGDWQLIETKTLGQNDWPKKE